jgi:hypothetical protein
MTMIFAREGLGSDRQCGSRRSHSLKDVASKLDGRHLLGDGRPINLKARYVDLDAMNSGGIVATITSQHAPLVEWDSHIFVVRRVIFFWAAYGGGDQGHIPVTVVRKFLLLDTRYPTRAGTLYSIARPRISKKYRGCCSCSGHRNRVPTRRR